MIRVGETITYRDKQRRCHGSLPPPRVHGAYATKTGCGAMRTGIRDLSSAGVPPHTDSGNPPVPQCGAPGSAVFSPEPEDHREHHRLQDDQRLAHRLHLLSDRPPSRRPGSGTTAYEPNRRVDLVGAPASLTPGPMSMVGRGRASGRVSWVYGVVLGTVLFSCAQAAADRRWVVRARRLANFDQAWTWRPSSRGKSDHR